MGKRRFVSLPDPTPLTDPAMATDAPPQLDTQTMTGAKFPGGTVPGQDVVQRLSGGVATSANPARLPNAML